MNEQVLIALIVAVAILAIIFLLRERLQRFGFKSKLFETEIETHRQELSPPSASAGGGVKISNNVMEGQGNRIEVRRGGTEVGDNQLRGENQDIFVGSEQDRQ